MSTHITLGGILPEEALNKINKQLIYLCLKYAYEKYSKIYLKTIEKIDEPFWGL